MTVRTTRGDDIQAACGQLVGQVLDRTKRQFRYQRIQVGKSYEIADVTWYVILLGCLRAE